MDSSWNLQWLAKNSSSASKMYFWIKKTEVLLNWWELLQTKKRTTTDKHIGSSWLIVLSPWSLTNWVWRLITQDCFQEWIFSKLVLILCRNCNLYSLPISKIGLPSVPSMVKCKRFLVAKEDKRYLMQLWRSINSWIKSTKTVRKRILWKVCW